MLGALVYIGILVTSTTTGPGGSVVCALASQAKGSGSTKDMQIMLFPLPIMLCSYARAPALLCPRKKAYYAPNYAN